MVFDVVCFDLSFELSIILSTLYDKFDAVDIALQIGDLDEAWLSK